MIERIGGVMRGLVGRLLPRAPRTAQASTDKDPLADILELKADAPAVEESRAPVEVPPTPMAKELRLESGEEIKVVAVKLGSGPEGHPVLEPAIPALPANPEPVAIQAPVERASEQPGASAQMTTQETPPSLAAIKPPEKAAEEPGKGDDLFKELFSKNEEKEQTPLDRLVAALPEVSMQELFEQAEGVKSLIREWQMQFAQGDRK